MDNSNAEYTANSATSQISTWHYASEALTEIKKLLKAVNNPTNTKLVFQSLPKHMRRRAASHHPKRLPRKYRIAHIAQMLKSGSPQAAKRPSRKYRRRVTNLMQEYLRRQRRHIWLETHIWHARRFHMINRWGYRLPYASCNKSFKASYRASAKHCLLQDISFHACIELRGTLEELRGGFSRMTSNKIGLGITAKTYTSGKREGSIDLFIDGQYPDGALGRVSFIWRVEKNCDQEQKLSKERTLWIWIHPSCYIKILEEFLKVFQLISTKNVSVMLNTRSETFNSGIDDVSTHNLNVNNSNMRKNKEIQFMTRTMGYTRIKHYVNTKKSIHLSELKDTLNRYRLTGPLSQSILTFAFKPKSFTLDNCKNTTGDWFKKLLNESEERRMIHTTQSNFWKQCSLLQSPVELMSNMIIGLNISDPVLHRPRVRTKVLVQSSNKDTINQYAIIRNIPENLHESEIWSAKLRDDIKKNILTMNDYSKLRAKYTVTTGMSSTFEDEVQTVPILLIQRPGSQENGYGCGWDIISPGGYGMSIWLSLIAWGAWPGGLREFDSIAQESLIEQHLPDTVSGLQLATEHHFEIYNKYFRLPPNKRCNYNKLAIVSPFRLPYMELVRDWLPDEIKLLGNERFHILRDRTILEKLTNCLNKRNVNFPEISPHALIQIQLCMKNRGNMPPFSIICLPKRIDLKHNFKKIVHKDNKPIFTEAVQFDCNAKERKLLRLQHKRLLKRLRAKRVRRKRKLQESSKTSILIEPACTKTLIAAQFKKMCNLWLPHYGCNILNSVRKQCSREVFGYVNIGGFNNTKSTVCGIGYVIAAGLKELIKVCNSVNINAPICLIRSPDSQQYRFASLKINLEV